MDETNCDYFEQLLQKQSVNSPSVLYKNVANIRTLSYKPQDVIETVYSQMKAIHLADISSVNRANKELNSVKNSNFLPVNKVPVYREKSNPNKFETQCISGTQLVNIIDDAEAIETPTGMTQEFNSTFAHIDDLHTGTLKKEETDSFDHSIFSSNEKISHQHPVLKENFECIYLQKDINESNSRNPYASDSSFNQANNTLPIEVDLPASTKFLSPKTTTKDDDTVTLIQNESSIPIYNELKDIFESDNSDKMDIDTGQYTQKTLSPVLNIKTVQNIKTVSPLIVPLEIFENFENIAQCIIEEHLDLEATKHLINSQILGKELCLNVNEMEKYRINSPILEFKNDELQVSSLELKTSNNKRTLNIAASLSGIENFKDKCNDSFKDEILFSSDEENEYNKDQNLSLTCALETTFDNEIDLLQKTMYVGFQTASNKCIQISTHSFDKAQSFLIDNDNVFEEYNLSELVEKCDISKDPKRIRDLVGSKEKVKAEQSDIELKSNKVEEQKFCKRESLQQYGKDEISSHENKNVVDIHDHKNSSKSQKCYGFVTANNKKIKIFYKAHEICQKVFKDIDLTENFDFDKTLVESNSSIGLDCCTSDEICKKTEVNRKTDFIKNNEQHVVDDNINDELLLQEFESIEMSLEEKVTHNETKHVATVNDIDTVSSKHDINVESKSEKSDSKVGFKTACNKNINLSEQSLANSNNMFLDIELEIDCIMKNDKNTKKHTMKTFEKPFDKKVDLTKNAFQDHIYKNININNNEIRDIDSINLAASSNTKFGVLKTDDRNITSVSSDCLSPCIEKGQGVINTECNSSSNNQFLINKSIFFGFKTASHKDIKISNEALYKCKDIFKDEIIPEININDRINQPSTSEGVFSGFKTANNKTIDIGTELLAKSKKIFNDIYNENAVLVNSINDDILFKNSTTFHNLHIDNNINVLDDNLVNHKYILNNVSKESNLPGKIGFKTASKKNINISSEALAKSKQLLDDTETEIRDDATKNIHFEGFKTASNKAINVSKEALAKTKKLLADINLQNTESNHLHSIEDGNTKPNTFLSIKKESVPISAKSHESNEQNIENDYDCVHRCHSKNMKITTIKDFKTASKKSVEVTTDFLTDSKKIFDEFNVNTIDNPNLGFVGFKTASNKDVNVSKEVIIKCKKIFEDIDIEETSTINNDYNIENNSKKVCYVNNSIKERRFEGFQTGSNKKVNVSEQALLKSRKLFHDIHSDIEIKDKYHQNDNKTISKDTNINIPFGFKTCNNKKVIVSKDALFKSKNVLNDKDTDNNKAVDTNKNISVENNLESILNTQIINNFEETLCTEDFKISPNRKRSSSPILSCPRAKKRKKFETPYKKLPKTIDFNKVVELIDKPVKVIQFNKNYKNNKQYTLKNLAAIENGVNIDPYILNFTLENILSIEFEDVRNDLSQDKITIDELKQLFTEAIDKKLLPDGWLDIQLKLILWKLISYEVKFPNTIGVVCTVRNIIDQLKYRYDKELYNAERPILRKILEKDDVSTKPMVLCVAEIYQDGDRFISATNLNNIELLLTDGWYFIKASIDKMLSKLVYDEKIRVGSKLVICGAELLNCEQGVAPWEDTSAVRLNISGNSTAPARWDARLGLRPNIGVTRLSRISVLGGKASRVRVLVTRLYPTLYVEKLQDGSTVTRSERLEHLYQAQYEADREALIEKIYAEVERDFSEQESQESINATGGSGGYLDSGSQIAKILKTCKDPMEFRAQLTPGQIQLLQEHTAKLHDKYVEAIQSRVRDRIPARNVVPLVRGRVVGLEATDSVVLTKAMLSIWKPNDAVLDIFKEGAWVEVMNVVPTAVRDSELQLSAGRQSVFRPVKCKNQEIFNPYLQTLQRKCFNIHEITQNPSMTTEYNEIDTVGIIFLIDPPTQLFESTKNQFQNVYLSDIDKNMICIYFWGGIKKFGYENILDTGQVIYCANLQKRAGNTKRNILQYRATEFTTFTKTPKNEKARSMIEEINKNMHGLDRRKFCEDCIIVKQNYSVINCLGTENISPCRFNNSDYNLGKNKMFIDTPIGVQVNKRKMEDFNLTGLDFESTFRQQDTQELSPKTLLRKKKVNDKIAKLKMYGEPPPLSPINITNKSKNVVTSYKSPLISNNSALNVQNVARDNNLETVQTIICPEKLDESSSPNSVEKDRLVTSPIISMNRTYIKKSVNPVKLNFSKYINENENNQKSMDEFADEFDGSPPLSLD